MVVLKAAAARCPLDPPRFTDAASPGWSPSQTDDEEHPQAIMPENQASRMVAMLRRRASLLPKWRFSPRLRLPHPVRRSTEHAPSPPRKSDDPCAIHGAAGQRRRDQVRTRIRAHDGTCSSGDQCGNRARPAGCLDRFVATNAVPHLDDVGRDPGLLSRRGVRARRVHQCHSCTVCRARFRGTCSSPRTRSVRAAAAPAG